MYLMNMEYNTVQNKTTLKCPKIIRRFKDVSRRCELSKIEWAEKVGVFGPCTM